MSPIFKIGPIELPAYFTLLMVGYTLAVYIAAREGERQGLDRNKLIDMGLWLLVAGIVGARVLHVVADGDWPKYKALCQAPTEVFPMPMPDGKKCQSDEDCKEAKVGEICNKEKGTCHVRDCLRVFKFWYGGLVFYGGLIFAIGTGLYLVRRYRLPTWKVGDLAGFTIPLGLFFGRMGCFFNGCCFGRICTSWLCLEFPKGSACYDYQLEHRLIPPMAQYSLPVYPTQLFEAIACLLIFFYLFWKIRRKTFDGQVFFLFLILYGIARFLVEFLRSDPRGELFGLSTSQLISIPAVVVGGFLYYYYRKRSTCER